MFLNLGVLLVEHKIVAYVDDDAGIAAEGLLLSCAQAAGGTPTLPEAARRYIVYFFKKDCVFLFSVPRTSQLGLTANSGCLLWKVFCIAWNDRYGRDFL